MIQFLRQCRSLCLLIAALVVGGIALEKNAVAQGTSSVRQPARPAGQRMGVIETQRPIGTTFHYTIIGAVARSGAYHSNESSIALEQLLDAAGGLASGASPTVKVFRNQQIRFQILYDPRQPDPANRLLPGDVVIATATDAVASTIPVACLGLLDRPVVLPLDPTIQTVNELTHRLLQSPEAARLASVISPQGDIQGRLTPGTVVIFSPGSIDRYPLMQPGALPEALELKKLQVSTTPISHVETTTTPSRMLHAPAPQTISEPSLELTLPGEAPEPAADLQSSMNAGSPSMGVAATAAPSLFLDASPLQHDSGAPSQHLYSAPEVDGVPVSRVIGTSAQVTPGTLPLVHAEQTLQLHGQLQQSPEGNLPMVSPFMHEEDPSAEHASQVRAQRYAALFEDQNATSGLYESGVSSSANGVSANDLSGETSYVKWPGLIGSLGGLLAIVVGIGFVLSHLQSPSKLVVKPRTRMPPEPVVTLQAAAMAAPQKQPQPQSQPPSQPATVAATLDTDDTQAAVNTRPAVASTTVQDEVEAIVQRTVPLVEETVRVPGHWQLHGTVVGHRRIVLHAAHPEVPVPHFAMKAEATSPQATHRQKHAAERDLRKQLKDALRPGGRVQDESAGHSHSSSAEEISPETRTPVPVSNTDDAVKSESVSRDLNTTAVTASENPVLPEVLSPPSMVPAPHMMSAVRAVAGSRPEYDIVQPELSQSPARSPLERALRTLASEKSG